MTVGGSNLHNNRLANPQKKNLGTSSDDVAFIHFSLLSQSMLFSNNYFALASSGSNILLSTTSKALIFLA